MSFEEVQNLFSSVFGFDSKMNSPEYVVQQKEHYNQIVNIYNKSSTQVITNWLNKLKTSERVDLKDFIESSEFQRKINNIKQLEKLSISTVKDKNNFTPVKNDKKYILWDLLKSDFDPALHGIKINIDLLNKLKLQLPTYTSYFKLNLLSYLSSDSKIPLVVSSSEALFSQLCGLIGFLLESLRGYTYEIVISPSQPDYELAPFGVWHCFRDSNLSIQNKEFLSIERYEREDKVGAFSLTVDDDKIEDNYEFRKFLKYYCGMYKTIIILDPWMEVTERHWIRRALYNCLTLEFTYND